MSELTISLIESEQAHLGRIKELETNRPEDVWDYVRSIIDLYEYNSFRIWQHLIVDTDDINLKGKLARLNTDIYTITQDKVLAEMHYGYEAPKFQRAEDDYEGFRNLKEGYDYFINDLNITFAELALATMEPGNPLAEVDYFIGTTSLAEFTSGVEGIIVAPILNELYLKSYNILHKQEIRKVWEGSKYLEWRLANINAPMIIMISREDLQSNFLRGIFDTNRPTQNWELFEED